MKLIVDDAAPRATLTATSTAGSLAVTNLLENSTEKVWRSTSTTATITLTWATQEAVDAVALGWCNFSPNTVVTIKRYALDGIAYDQIVVTADYTRNLSDFVPNSGVLVVGSARGQQVPMSVEGWFTTWGYTKKVEITIEDSADINLSGYVEAARICVGLSHTMTSGPDYGALLQYVDNSKPQRAESGALRWIEGAYWRKIDLEFSLLNEIDITALSQLKIGQTIYVSVFPGDQYKQQRYAMFCSPMDSMFSRFKLPNSWSSSLSLEEVA